MTSLTENILQDESKLGKVVALKKKRLSYIQMTLKNITQEVTLCITATKH